MIWLISQLIDDAAEEDARREALRCLDASLSYGEAARRSNQIAHLLCHYGVKRGDRVGILLFKGFDMILSAYAVMKAGAAYVPLDPFAPDERITGIIRDCGIKVLLTQKEKAKAAARAACEAGLETVVGLEEIAAEDTRAVGWHQVDEYSGAAAPDVRLIEDDLAYIIYTSGSTGKPKGIVHTHRSGMAFLRWATEVYGIRPEDRLSNHSPLHFDMSMLEFYGAARKGATTVIIPEEHKRLPASYAKLLEEERITVMYTVPFALLQFLRHGALERRDLTALRWVIFGGESFEAENIRKLMTFIPRARFSHVYGPTEANACTYWHLPRSPNEVDDPMPVGEDCPNSESILVDEEGRVLTGEQTGELWLRGPALMQGYWNRPDLNRRVFVAAETAGGRKATYYRTGDLIRRGRDGNYFFVGRRDGQVKIRGFRIELSEIEEALRELREVEEAVAFGHEDEAGNSMVMAAVTGSDPEKQLPGDLLIERVRERLASYALPRKVVCLEEFPRASSGKIDLEKVREAVRTALEE